MSAAVRLLVGIALVIVAEVFYHECSKYMHFQLGENSDNKVILCQRMSCINQYSRQRGSFLLFLSQFFHGVQFVYEAKYLTKYNLPPLKVVGLEGES